MVGLADPPDQWRIAPGTDRVYVGTSERDTPLHGNVRGLVALTSSSAWKVVRGRVRSAGWPGRRSRLLAFPVLRKVQRKDAGQDQ
jgi:hypothetical protein